MSIYKSLPDTTPDSTATSARDNRRSLRYVFFALFAFFFAGTLSYLITQNPTDSSATVAGFNPGNIINDYTMGNYNSMTEAEIQAFLTAKNPCNNTNLTQYQNLVARYGDHLSWHFENGHFVCLSEERFGDGIEIGVPNGETAAHIIWQAAQDYKINPQVLIVLLEKEQSLITDTYPNNVQYRSATGYGCPDSDVCNSKYYGLKNQIRNAAALFRLGLDGKSSYYPIGNNYVLYNPDESCDGSWVYIENRATGVLYRYTPYQPNSAALAAGTGTGNYCSSYGNRNFYHFFTEWFGSTQTTIDTAKFQTIANGEYTIISGITTDTALSVAGNGSNIIMAARSSADTWLVTFNTDDQTYTFTNKKTSSVLSLDNATVIDGTNAQLFGSTQKCTQKWRLLPRENDGFSLISSCSDMKVLDVAGAQPTAGANVQAYTYNGTPAQVWKIIPNRSIADGLYEISAVTNANLRVDIQGGISNATNNTNIQAYTSNQTAAQKWQFTFDAQNGTYTITNPNTRLRLSAALLGTQNHTNVVVAAQDSCQSRWYVLPAAKSGKYNIISSCGTGLALDISGGSSRAGANIQVYEQNGTAAQQWTIQSISLQIIEDGVYMIIPHTNEKMALDISGGASRAKDGTNVQIYEQNGTDAQKWQLTYDFKTDAYIISNTTSKLTLDLSGASYANGANIQVYQSNSTCAQRWRIEESSPQLYTIISACSEKVVDVSGAGTTNGTNVWQYEGNQTPAQKWHLQKIQ